MTERAGTGSSPADAPKGRLVLVPAPLDFGSEQPVDLAATMPAATIRAAAALHHWVCENAKTARAYLKRIGAVHPLAAPLQELQIRQLPREVHKKGDHQGEFDARDLLAPALAGHDVGLLSEAGMPAIADPGSSVVRAAHDLGIGVVPLVGPVSLVLALAASGLNGQNFAFVGYLPQDPAERATRIREVESRVKADGQTQLFIETPYRNAVLLQALLQVLSPDTRLLVATNLTLEDAVVTCQTVRRWRSDRWRPGDRSPAVFAIGR